MFKVHGTLLTSSALAFIFMMTMLVPSNTLSSTPEEKPKISEAKAITAVALWEEDGLTKIEKKIRSAAVKVRTRTGHGSGSYVKVGGFHIVLTAEHVANGPIGSVYGIITPSHERISGRLVYSNALLDVAAILIQPLKTRVPMDFRPVKSMPPIGTSVAYAGHPSDFSMLSFRGMISGHEQVKGDTPSIVMNSYGWFGCSGSAVYDTKGNLVGVLWGVSVDYLTPDLPQVQEDLVFLTPGHLIKKQQIIDGICKQSHIRPEQCSNL